jgi:hypothetical protein
MTDPQHLENAEPPAPRDISEPFLAHINGALQGVTNLKWDDVDYHLAAVRRLLDEADDSDRQLYGAVHEPIRDFALGFRLFSTHTSPDEREQALDHFTKARDALRDLRMNARELAGNPGFTQFALGVETQIVSVQRQIAYDQHDARRTAQLDGQISQLMDEMIDSLAPEDPQRFFMVAIRHYQTALFHFAKGSGALQEMNLDLAQQYLADASAYFGQVQENLSRAELEGALLKATRDVIEGFALLVGGQDVYVRILRAAIIGDVTRSDVLDLEKAERSFLDGADRVARGSAAMPGIFGGMDIRPIASQTSLLARNLRTLCERSLSPKAITLTTAPRVLFYFLGTFIVLLIGLPLSGLIERLEFNNIAFLLGVSLLVSVIAAFGFEAARFIPLFDAFTRVLPWARGAEK